MQLVVPSAVTIADAMAAIICTMNLMVSFLLIILCVLLFYLFTLLPLNKRGAVAP